MPNMSFQAVINGEPREIFMSFALLNRLTFLVGDVADTHTVMVNPEMREAILKEMLAERTPSGKLIKAVEDLDDVAISLNDTMNLLEFVADHLLDFFTVALKKMQALQGKYVPQIQAAPVVK